jgi:hypothetical protein
MPGMLAERRRIVNHSTFLRTDRSQLDPGQELSGERRDLIVDQMGKLAARDRGRVDLGDDQAPSLRLRQRSWETPEGDKRSVIEADEVGASLKWATIKVERTSQCGNGDRAQGRERAAECSGDFNDAPPF